MTGKRFALDFLRAAAVADGNVQDALAEPNAQLLRGKTPFLLLLQKGRLTVADAKALLEAGALPNVIDRDGNSPLSAAVERTDVPMVRLLIRAGADIEKYEETTGKSLLALLRENARGLDHTHLVTEQDIVDILLLHGANPNARDSDGTPLLVRYAAIGAERAVADLLRSGADPNDTGLGKTYPAAYYAITRHQTEILDSLLAAGTDVNRMEGNRATPLVIAVESRNARAVTLLLAAGADPNGSGSAVTPLISAACSDQFDIFDTLLSHGAGIDRENCHGLTLLQHALNEQLPPAMIQHILRNGADPDRHLHDKCGTAGQPPLHLCVMHGLFEQANILLKHNADPLLENKEGITALAYASRTLGKDHVLTLRLTLAEGAARQQSFPSEKACRRGIFPPIE